MYEVELVVNTPTVDIDANTPSMDITAQGNGAPVWGAILGTLSNQTDLQTALNAKANITYVDEKLATKADIATTLAGYGITDAKIEGGVITLGSNTITPITSHQDISGKADLTYVNTQLATKQNTLTAGSNVQINNNVISATDTTYTAGTGISIVDNVISNTQTSAEWGNITGTLSNQTDLMTALNAKVTGNNAITGATKCKVTYDSKGLVTAGADLVAGDIPDLSSVYYPVTNPSNYQTATQVSASISAYHDSTKYDVSNPNGYTANIGTITGITMNGASKGTSGVVNLGTVLTAHQDISGKENTSNKVTSISAQSTDTQYPSAKCVYDIIGNVEALLEALL